MPVAWPSESRLSAIAVTSADPTTTPSAPLEMAVVAAIQNELGVPARFIGTGEKAEDFEAFEPKRFVDQIL